MPRKNITPQSELRVQRNSRQAIGKRIARARLALGVSQEELADRFGVSRAHWSQLECGTAGVDAGDMGLLCEVLNVPVTYFYSPDDTEPPNLVVNPDDELRHVYVQVKHMEERLADVIARTKNAQPDEWPGAFRPKEKNGNGKNEKA